MKRRRVTLKDLAAATGVSITTASNAFSRPDQLSDELRNIVLKTADAMGYRGPATEGRLLRTGHAGAIALYAREPLGYLLRDPCAALLVDAVAELCQQRQAGLVMLPSVPYEAGVDGRLPTALEVAAVDGFLMYCLPDDDPSIARIVDRARPVVAIDMSVDARFAGVNIDDRSGARLAVARVLGRGCRRPAILSLPVDADRRTRRATRAALDRAPFPVTRERWAGYVEGLEARGVRTLDVPVAVVRANARRDGELAAGELLTGRGRRPDALLAMTDVLALGALDACRALGLSVPADVAVIGFDDVGPDAAEAGLTTIRQDVRAKARRAAEVLFDAPDTASSVLAVELVARDSA